MITYKKLPAFLGADFETNYKGVTATIALGDDWLSIYSIESKDKKQGEVKEFIKLLRKDYPDKELCSSVPLNPIWKYICKKYNIKYE